MTATIEIEANGKPFTVPQETRLPDFVRQLDLVPENVVVERNRQALTPSEARDTVLAEGDRLEIVRIVAGG